MATTYEVTSFRRPPVFAAGYPGKITVLYTVNLEDLTADASYQLLDGDILKFFKLPAKAVILGGGIASDELDDHATPALVMDLQVTDGTTTKTVLDAATTFGAARNTYSSYDSAFGAGDGIGYVTTDDDFRVQLEVITSAAGDAAASATLTVWIDYTMNEIR